MSNVIFFLNDQPFKHLHELSLENRLHLEKHWAKWEEKVMGAAYEQFLRERDLNNSLIVHLRKNR